MFCLVDIIICCLQKLGEHTLHIISDIASLRQRSGIRNGKRHLKKPRQSLYQIRLSGTGRPDHEHVGFIDLDLFHGVGHHPFIVIVDRHRHDLFCIILSYDIFIQHSLDLVRCRNIS